MKPISKVTLAILIFSGIVGIQSCKKDSSTTSEFIADNNSFSSFMSWSNDKTYHGPDPLLGTFAHANNDSSVTRKVYFKNGENPINGKYSIGTIIVKHSYNPGLSVNEVLGMVKRGNNFNPGKGDWEYFVLTSAGAIAKDNAGMAMRGASLMGGMCISCHAGASHDYVFSK